MQSEEYYNKFADEFYNSTCNVNLSDIYKKFEKYLNKNTHILDAGCGSGRDSKYFLSKGYRVSAFDASKKMVLKATQLTGLNVKQMYFQDIQDSKKYDAIWSCASLLHVPKNQINEVIQKFICALKDSGIWYMSFKYGELERKKNDRLFNDYTESSLQELLSKYPQLQILEMWLTADKRVDRNDKWINVIVRNMRID